MAYNPEKHNRRSIRLKDYDYSTPGAYFVTICTQDHECIFGEIIDGEMQLNEIGTIMDEYWNEISKRYKNVELDKYITMPNHIHIILMITDNRNRVSKGGETPPQRLGQIIAYYKYQTTKIINEKQNKPGVRLLQRNYYDHIERTSSAAYSLQSSAFSFRANPNKI